MRKALVIACLWLAALCGTSAFAQASDFILRISGADPATIAARYGVTIVRQIEGQPGVYLVRGTINDDDRESAVENDDSVDGFESNHPVRVSEAPRGRLSQSTAAILETLPDRTPVPFFGTNQVWQGFAQQPATVIIRTLEAHNASLLGSGIVAVIDTGVDGNHPALAGAVLPGYDFITDQIGASSDMVEISQSTAAILESRRPPEPYRTGLVNQSTAAILEQSTAAILEGTKLPPAFGHGTMVASLIRLVAPGAMIMPLRAFNSSGAGSEFDIIRAIYYATDHGANVINMSFSLTDWSPELLRAVDYATGHNVICVAAAGNSGQETLVYPSAFNNVVGVGSTDNLDNRSSFSNFGDGLVSVVAPGEALITAFPGQRYAAAWGTSFSAALVSGAAAMVQQMYPGISPYDAEQFLSRARHLNPGMGQGRIDLLLMLKKMSKPL
jgi:subtilisin family serine protease